MAFRHHTVHGNASARLDYHDIACRHIFCGNHLFDAVPQDNRRLRGQIHQLTERVGGLCLGPRFQILSYGDQCQNHGTGLKIQFMAVLMHKVHVPVAETIGHPIHGKHAIYKSRRRSYRHQRVHVGRFFHQCLKTGLVKMAVDDHYRNSEQQLGQSGYQGIFHTYQKSRDRQRHHRPHRHIHQRNQYGYRGYQTPFHFLLVLFRHFSPVLPFFPESAVLLGFRSGAGRPVANFRNRMDNGLFICLFFIISHRHLVRQQADVYLLHPIQLSHIPGDVRLTGCTGHPCYMKLFVFQ